jgi:hypothetical protein
MRSRKWSSSSNETVWAHTLGAHDSQSLRSPVDSRLSRRMCSTRPSRKRICRWRPSFQPAPISTQMLWTTITIPCGPTAGTVPHDSTRPFAGRLRSYGHCGYFDKKYRVLRRVDERTEIHHQSILTFMATEDLKETIKRELPALLRSDRALRRFVLDLTQERYAEPHRSEDRLDKILDKLWRDRAQRPRKRGHGESIIGLTCCG